MEKSFTTTIVRQDLTLTDLGRYLADTYPDFLTGNAHVRIMAGHFMGVPDYDHNQVYPSIHSYVPEHLHGVLNNHEEHPDDPGIYMGQFSLDSFRVGAHTVQYLKAMGISSGLSIIANDITGLTEIRDSSVNTDRKSVADYKQQLLASFGDSIPDVYSDTLLEHQLSLNNLDAYLTGHRGEQVYYVRENALREKFRSLIRRNKGVFDGIIGYHPKPEDGGEEFLFYNLPQPKIKACALDRFGRDGGNPCSVVMVSYLMNRYGCGGHLIERCQRIPEFFVPKKRYDKNLFIAMVPARCDLSIQRAFATYRDLFAPTDREVKLLLLAPFPRKTTSKLNFTTWTGDLTVIS